MKRSPRKEVTPTGPRDSGCEKILSKDKADKPIDTPTAELAALKSVREAWDRYKATAS
jgi:hypothetical protein